MKFREEASAGWRHVADECTIALFQVDLVLRTRGWPYAGWLPPASRAELLGSTTNYRSLKTCQQNNGSPPFESKHRDTQSWARSAPTFLQALVSYELLLHH
jgi:hypothetical protein